MVTSDPGHKIYFVEEFIKSTFQDIVSDEMRKIKESSSIKCFKTLVSGPETDALWEYDGLHAAYEVSVKKCCWKCKEFSMRTLKKNKLEKLFAEPDNYAKTWEDEEDEYLARAVFEHMQLNDDKIKKNPDKVITENDVFLRTHKKKQGTGEFVDAKFKKFFEDYTTRKKGTGFDSTAGVDASRGVVKNHLYDFGSLVPDIFE